MTTDLYGGAITIARLPSTFIDVSKLRQIPDNQEVFINQTPHQNANLDKSLIVDVLEKINHDEYDKVINEHLSDVYPNPECNKLMEKLTIDGVDRYISILKYHPQYTKSEPNQPKLIISLIGLIQLNKVSTDILIHYNIPYEKEQEEIEVGSEDYDQFKTIVQSLTIKDWTLFG